MSEAYVRCFVALIPDAPTRQRLQTLPRMGRARAVAPEDLHLTVAFLGDLASAPAHGVAQGLSALVRAITPLEAVGLALWPTPQRARVIVAGFALVPELEALHNEVMVLAQQHGVPGEDRRYRPHITVARLPRTLRVMPQQALDNIRAELGPAVFTHLGLYARAPEGAEQRYQTLVEIPLPS